MMAWQQLPLMQVLSAAAPAMTLGHAVGRIGCFLVGDDYGRPTSLPWGMAFPEGLPPTTDRVHPTQLYEVGGAVRADRRAGRAAEEGSGRPHGVRHLPRRAPARSGS